MTPPDSDPHGWLETDAIRRVSDIALGVIMLLVGAFALWGAQNYPSGGLTDVKSKGSRQEQGVRLD